MVSPVLNIGGQSLPAAAGPTLLCEDFHFPHLSIDSLEVVVWDVSEAFQYLHPTTIPSWLHLCAGGTGARDSPLGLLGMGSAA